MAVRSEPDLAQVLHLREALRSRTKASRLIMCRSRGDVALACATAFLQCLLCRPAVRHLEGSHHQDSHDQALTFAETSLSCRVRLREMALQSTLNSVPAHKAGAAGISACAAW